MEEEDVDELAPTSQNANGLQNLEIQFDPLDIHMGIALRRHRQQPPLNFLIRNMKGINRQTLI